MRKHYYVNSSLKLQLSIFSQRRSAAPRRERVQELKTNSPVPQKFRRRKMTPFLSKLTRFRRLVWGAMILATLSLVLPVAFAQSEKGSLSGIVTDATGAVVAGATVTATDIGTNAS